MNPVGAVVAIIFALLLVLKSPYLGWDCSDPETAVLGTAFFAAENTNHDIPSCSSDTQLIPQYSQTTDADTQSLTSSVAVFFLGILAGYVIDGVFVYATEYSAAELTSSMIDKIVNFVKGNRCHHVSVDENGNIVGTGISGKFSLDYSFA